jgi:hypothetical protein
MTQHEGSPTVHGKTLTCAPHERARSDAVRRLQSAKDLRRRESDPGHGGPALRRRGSELEEHLLQACVVGYLRALRPART